MAVLHFLAKGSFQFTVSVTGGMSQPTFTVVLQEVLCALQKHPKNYIQFPNQQDFATVKGDFYALRGLPYVFGAIDGALIALVPPQARKQVYSNQKNYHFINVQVVCSVDLNISSVCARFPRSTRDSFVLHNSTIPLQMSQLALEQAWLVGDSAYPNRPWLLATLRNLTMPGEVRFNEAYRRTRRPVKQAFGFLKERFRCPYKAGEAFLYSPDKLCQLAVACCILQNVALHSNIPIMAEDCNCDKPPGEDFEMPNEDDSGKEGIHVYQDDIDHFFN
ncbi:putative nuclease HARBI1 [Pleurodeles waltl]|uniref:putative nuclease HARBI1 n=1 Tax=Pleurodeles waltl TaxID=8319 RepID=UPI0037099A36